MRVRFENPPATEIIGGDGFHRSNSRTRKEPIRARHFERRIISDSNHEVWIRTPITTRSERGLYFGETYQFIFGVEDNGGWHAVCCLTLPEHGDQVDWSQSGHDNAIGSRSSTMGLKVAGRVRILFNHWGA